MCGSALQLWYVKIELTEVLFDFTGSHWPLLIPALCVLHVS